MKSVKVAHVAQRFAKFKPSRCEWLRVVRYALRGSPAAITTQIQTLKYHWASFTSFPFTRKNQALWDSHTNQTEQAGYNWYTRAHPPPRLNLLLAMQKIYYKTSVRVTADVLNVHLTPPPPCGIASSSISSAWCWYIYSSTFGGRFRHLLAHSTAAPRTASWRQPLTVQSLLLTSLRR